MAGFRQGNFSGTVAQQQAGNGPQVETYNCYFGCQQLLLSISHCWPFPQVLELLVWICTVIMVLFISDEFLLRVCVCVCRLRQGLSVKRCVLACLWRFWSRYAPSLWWKIVNSGSTSWRFFTTSSIAMTTEPNSEGSGMDAHLTPLTHVVWMCEN